VTMNVRTIIGAEAAYACIETPSYIEELVWDELKSQAEEY